MSNKKVNKIVRYQYVFFSSFHEAMNELEDGQYGRLMRAINEFALYGDEPSNLNSAEERMAWKLIRPILLKGRNKARTINANQSQTERKSIANQTQIVANPSLDISKDVEMDEDNDMDNGGSCGNDDYYYEHFLKWYNEAVQNTNIPKIIVMTDNRKKLFDHIRNKYGSDKIAEVVGKAIASDYLSGEKDGTPRMTIDWLFQEENFIRAMEGVYND